MNEQYATWFTSDVYPAPETVNFKTTERCAG